MPSSPYRIDMESRIAPHFQVPKNAAAVSGVGGSSMATRSPFATPCARSTLANRFDCSCSSPHRTSRTLPSKSSWTIASLSAGCLSQTSWAMLYRSGTCHSCCATASSYDANIAGGYALGGAQRDIAPQRNDPLGGAPFSIAFRLALLDLVLELLHDVRVAQRRHVAELAALGDVAQQPAHDLAGAGLGQVVGPDDPLRAGELADPARHVLADVRHEVVVALGAAAQRHERGDRL